MSLTYEDAGVNISEGERFVKLIKPTVKATFRPEVLTDIGSFGAMFSFNSSNYKSPVLVSSTDGVGTKLRIAFMMDRHDTVGIDLVAMNVNDIIVQGAEPLFFLDYFATSNLDAKKAAEVIKGIAAGCKEAGCALIGGETAEMPSFYADGEYDLAGFVVGVVDNDKIIDGTAIRIGDKIIGLASSGLHSNGYSLARKVFFEILGKGIDDNVGELGKTVGEALIEPTLIYVRAVKNILKEFQVNGIAHITGGGFHENIKRIIPNSCSAKLDLAGFEVPALFRYIKDAGKISGHEMLRTFNCGIGMILIVPDGDVEDVIHRAKAFDNDAYLIGEIVEKEGGDTVIIENVNWG